MKKQYVTFIALAAVIIAVIFIGYKVVQKPNESQSDTSNSINKDVPDRKTSYICDGGKKIIASFFEGLDVEVKAGEQPVPTGSVSLILNDGRTIDLSQTLSAGGVRYANKDESFVFWSKGNGAQVLENNLEKEYVNCVISN